MSESRNALAWRMLCQRWQSSSHWFDNAVPPAQRPAFEHLVELKAVKHVMADSRYVLCGHCGLHRAEVYQEGAALEMHCPDCGPVPVRPENRKAWNIDPDWLVRKLRGGLDIAPQHAPVALAGSAWQIGAYRRRPVILARSLNSVLRNPTVVLSTRGTAIPWLITPRPTHDVDADPLPGIATWLPLDDRFTLYGGNVTLADLDRPSVPASNADATHGPFSEDFRWVHLDDSPGDPIALSEAQASVFEALWHFAGRPQEAHTIMSRADLMSDKPIDVFKVKPKNKGDPKYEDPLRAYQLLVVTNRRAGTYAMACAMACAMTTHA